jgi:predicted homoserine dehydrogenase-like protein
LDGEGGHTVYGKLIPAERSLAMQAMPIGVAHGMRLRRPVKAGALVSWNDVSFDERRGDIAVRREMEALFSTTPARAANG